MKPGPYDLCSCGSGKKSKFCCGAKSAYSQPVQWGAPAQAAGQEAQLAQLRAAIAQQLQEGLAAHRAGRLAEADAIYRRVMVADPRNANALQLLGVLAYQVGQFAPAIELIGRAIAINPEVPDYHANLGHALKDSGNLPAAEASYRRALQGRPAYPDVLNNLGLVLQAQGRPDEAAASFQQALDVDPDSLLAVMNLGALRHARGDLAGAEACYLRALALKPAFAQALNNLGTVLQARGSHAEAQQRYQQALTLAPAYGDALGNLGGALEAQGDLTGAEAAYREAIGLGGNFNNVRLNLGALLRRRGELAPAIRQFQAVIGSDPLHAQAHLNMGVARQDEGRLAEALAHYLLAQAQGLAAPELENNIAAALGGLGRLDRALVLLRRIADDDPQSVQTRVNIGSNLFSQGRLAEAMHEMQAAIALEPGHVNAKWNIALLQVAMGRFPEMWEAYEWRLARDIALFGKPTRPYAHAPWDGLPLPGKTLLIFPEQGVGDEIWAAGMYEEVLSGPARDGRAVIECRPKLLPLFRRSFATAEVVPWTEPPDAKCMEGVDVQIAGGSLGQYFRRDATSFPLRETTGGAYLFADAGREAYWRHRIAALGPGLKVGVCWRSSNTGGERALSCTQLMQWREVFGVPGVHFINIQYDECEAELRQVEQTFGVNIQRYPEVDMYDDLDETSALLRGLDLVIGAPTSVSIMSAALGVPTWQMDYGTPGQLHGLRNNPWYPAMRNYPRRWDQQWEEILERIADDLAALAGTARVAKAPTVLHARARSQFASALALLHDGDRVAARALLQALESDELAGLAARALAAATGGGAEAGTLESRLALAAAACANTLFEFVLDLGNAYRLAGSGESARALLGQATVLDGRSAAAWQALGAAALGENDHTAAVQALEEARRCDPPAGHIKLLLADAVDKLAMLDIAAGRNAEAIPALARAAALNPDSAEIQFHYGCALQAVERNDEATAAYRRTAGLRPDFAPAWNNLANTLRACRRLDESIECFRRAFAIDGNLDGVNSNLLLTMNYAEGIAAETFFAEHLEFGKRVASRIASNPESAAFTADAANAANVPDPARRLRIGYVSADFRAHPVTRFLEPILAHHDRSRFEVYCYACSSRTDEFTEKIRAGVDGWRSIAELDDDAAAKLVRDDAIDILVDLAGHTALNRLPVFARKPAPVQVSYLGYPATTGLAAVDYKIVDSLTAAPGHGLDAMHTEALWRLDGPMWAFGPAAGIPEVSAPPATRNGFITFGSFNSVIKVGSGALRAWAEILRAVPGSRLMLATVAEGETRAQLDSEFAELGIDVSRLTYHARLEPAAFWALYAKTDIALDTFPCNGGTTTFETLWMGVPVIALAGTDSDILVSHISAGILRGLGFDELVGANTGDYARRAVELARDTSRLAQLRAGLRDRLSVSKFLDHAGFVADLERAYRAMWQRWCVTQMETAQ